MEGARSGFDEVGAHDHPIMRGGPGGAEKWKPSRRGSVFAGRCITKAGGVEGGPMEGARADLMRLVHAVIRSCMGSWVVQKTKPSRRGSVLPGRCETKAGEGRGGSNGEG
jgi:hypothetical protein